MTEVESLELKVKDAYARLMAWLDTLSDEDKKNALIDIVTGIIDITRDDPQWSEVRDKCTAMLNELQDSGLAEQDED
jgi:hypothetical protein